MEPLFHEGLDKGDGDRNRQDTQQSGDKNNRWTLS
jgi:hypothetical protein